MTFFPFCTTNLHFKLLLQKFISVQCYKAAVIWRKHLFCSYIFACIVYVKVYCTEDFRKVKNEKDPTKISLFKVDFIVIAS